MVRPSRDMLTTGVVGGYLLGSVWLLLFVASASALFVQGMSWSIFELGPLIAILLGLCGLVWLGGAICEGIGWIGLNRLHPGLAGVIGWIEAAMPVTSILVFVVVLSTLGKGVALLHALVILQLTYYALALLWFSRRGPRRYTVPAIVGHALALVGGGGLYVCGVAEIDPGAFGYILLLTGLAGLAVGHLANALFLGQSRLLADSVNTFG